MSAIVCVSPPLTKAPLSHCRPSGGVSSATPARSCALARILPVALVIAAGVPSDGLVLKPCPVPKRFVSFGTTLTSSAGTPSSSATSCAYWSSRPSGSVVRLSTILPVGGTRRKTARYASFATVEPPLEWSRPALRRPGLTGRALALQAPALLVGAERVVLLEVAEARLRPAQRVRRHRRALAAGIDAGLLRLAA